MQLNLIYFLVNLMNYDANDSQKKIGTQCCMHDMLHFSVLLQMRLS